MKPHSKLDLSGPRVTVTEARANATLSSIFRAIGCAPDVSDMVAHHLADASLSGVESHGLMRVLQYADQFRSGYMLPQGTASIRTTETGVTEVEGGGGIGIPAMALAFDHARDLARDSGIAALAVRNVGHTGRHGAFAETAAQAGFLTFLMGGGNRTTWRQVAPHGGARALLPTNPWCIGIPGGDHGPVVLDFATSQIAGGWIYAARSAGARLPENAVIDRHGTPTRDPEDYFNGGAILPSGGHKGYGLALMAELIAEALLGPVTTEANWLLICIDTARHAPRDHLRATAEGILSELRACPPAPGYDRVEVPGERERNHRIAAAGKIAVPQATWDQIIALAAELDA